MTRTPSRASCPAPTPSRCSGSTARPSRSTSRPTAATASRCAASPASTRTPPAPSSPTRPWRSPTAAPAATDGGFPVELRDDAPIRGRAGCDRYVARVVRGIDVAAPTPRWMAVRLTEAGMRPISLPVDVTNYVMLGLGQPLHAFDLATLEGPIVVRRARAGERLTTLDDVDRALDPGDLLITDHGGDRAVAIAGVMGGAETEVGATTRDVLIEAAHFEPVTDRPLGPPAQAAQRGLAPLRARRRPGARGRGGPARRRPARRARRGSRPTPTSPTSAPRPTPAPVTMHVDFPSKIVGIVYLESEVVSVLRGHRLLGHPRRAPAHGDPADLAPRPHHGRGPRRGGRPHRRLRAHPLGHPDPAGRRRAHPRPAGAARSSPTCSPGRACPRCGARRSSAPTATPRWASTSTPRWRAPCAWPTRCPTSSR